MSSLTLDGVSKRYGDAVALADVSLTVEDGEFFTLVGPSGCGKTTTLRTIAGFETPTEGTVAFGGEVMGTTPPEERSVGVVFQQYALFPHLSVGENVAYGLRFTDHPDPDARVAELLDLVGLDGFRDREPGELSGGQQQRVALARALAPEPDVLLLDEPMSALDARLRQRLRREVRAIQRDLGVTTVYVTHDQAEALAVSDRVARLEEAGVVKRFTLDIDRSQLQKGIPVLLTIEVAREGPDVSAIRSTLLDSGAVEHVFTSADGELIVYARVPDNDVSSWLTDTVPKDAIANFEVTLLSAADWSPDLGGAEFALTCAQCENTVDSEGTATRIDGELYQFCCQSCEARFTEKYEQLQKGAD